MIALLVMTDGRDELLERCLAQPELRNGLITERWIHDDTGDEAHRARLTASYPDFRVLGSGPRRGFGGAVDYAWAVLAERATARLVLHWEDDFLANRPVDLVGMAGLLDAHPHLAQVALKRQPWGREPAGGFMADAPGWYSDHSDGRYRWVETVRNWTTNPALFRRELCAGGWPDGQHSEGHYGFGLRERGLPWGVPGDAVRFGLWGATGDEPAVHHIGDVRVGTGY